MRDIETAGYRRSSLRDCAVQEAGNRHRGQQEYWRVQFRAWCEA